MSKNNGTSEVSKAFLDRLDTEAGAEHPIFTPEKKNELHLIIRDFIPDLRKYIAQLSREEQAKKLMNAELTLRVAEYKANQVTAQLQKMSEILENHPYTKQTRAELISLIVDAVAWLNTI